MAWLGCDNRICIIAKKRPAPLNYCPLANMSGDDSNRLPSGAIKASISHHRVYFSDFHMGGGMMRDTEATKQKKIF